MSAGHDAVEELVTSFADPGERVGRSRCGVAEGGGWVAKLRE